MKVCAACFSALGLEPAPQYGKLLQSCKRKRCVEVLVCVEDMARSSLQAAEGERLELCTIIWSLPQPAKEKTSFQCLVMYAMSFISFRINMRSIRFVKK